MRLNNQLSPLLAHPTPANIRRECANVYQERFDKKDEPMLRAFFGPPKKEGKFLEHIQEFDVDRFRPLDTFLKEEGKKNISDRNIDLLAWLIDFKHRPFSFGMEVFLTEKEHQITTEGPVIDPTEDEPNPALTRSSGDVNESGIITGTPIIDTQDPPPSKKEEIVVEKEKEGDIIHTIISRIKGWKKIYKAAVVVFVSLLVSFGGIYLYSKRDRSEQISFREGNTGCMYWTGDHYDTIPCTENRNGRLVLPIDPEKMKNFQRITREDTITEKLIGKIYYIRINGGREYYTAGGHHPVDVTRTLKVLSRYIFDTHLRKKETSGKESLVESNKKP
jgi:hypothetical protein